MLMNEGLDTGDILLKKEVGISDEETGGSLFDKLSLVGADLILETIEGIEKGEIEPVPQDESKATKVGMLNKSMGELDFQEAAEALERLVRGLDPWPGAYTFVSGKKLSVWRCSVSDDIKTSETSDPGTVSDIGREYIDVQCGKGVLRLLEVQLEGKKRMDVNSFLNGFKLNRGDKLGREKEK